MFNYNIPNSKNQELLQEISKRKAQQRIYAPIIAKAISELSNVSDQTACAIYNCGTHISISPSGRITGANFCRNRYCPICQWRASRKVYGQVAKIYDYIAMPESRFALLTLTIRNTVSLEDGLAQCFEGLKRFTNSRKIKKSIQGWMRTLEITYNEQSNTWHPHIHMLLHLADGYFTASTLYLEQKDYETIWRTCVRADYITQVDVRAIKDDVAGALAEVAKYAVKPSSVLTSHAEVETIRELVAATYHRRLRSFGGSFKRAAKALNIQADLVDELPQPSGSDTVYIYTHGKYVPKAFVPQKELDTVAMAAISLKTAQQTCNCCKIGGDVIAR